jgi:hypothetical protein
MHPLGSRSSAVSSPTRHIGCSRASLRPLPTSRLRHVAADVSAAAAASPGGSRLDTLVKGAVVLGNRDGSDGWVILLTTLLLLLMAAARHPC